MAGLKPSSAPLTGPTVLFINGKYGWFSSSTDIFKPKRLGFEHLPGWEDSRVLVGLGSRWPPLPVICIPLQRCLRAAARPGSQLCCPGISGRQARKRILLCQLFPAVAFDKGPYSLARPSTPLRLPPTCQWISNYWPSWGRIFGWVFLMWQQQVRWSGSGPRLWSVTVPVEKGNLNWCRVGGGAQHLCLFFTLAQGSLSLLTVRAASLRAACGLHSITHCNIWWANTLGKSEPAGNRSRSSVGGSAAFRCPSSGVMLPGTYHSFSWQWLGSS